MTDYFNLGTYTRPITTSSPQAKLWFDRGLRWCYGFNHEEAVVCFRKAAELDPSCALAHWGIAYASGPNYNRGWDAFTPKELPKAVQLCYAAAQEAKAQSLHASPVEQALIQALLDRYQSDQVVEEETFSRWNDDYARAMGVVYEQFPFDADVCALYATGLMVRTPWQLWDLKSGAPAEGADTAAAINVLEQAIQQRQDAGQEPHPGLLHMYIHVMEMSPHPERALRAADALRNLMPDSGHLLHMPSHIDLLCGHYYNAVEANTRAVHADGKYLVYAGAANGYTMYRTHNHHFRIYAAMFLGQFQTALAAADDLRASITEDLLRLEQPRLVDKLEGLISMRLHVLIRFGRWQQIIDEPFPDDPELYCHTTAMLHYAKGVAYAASGDVPAAQTEQALFEQAAAQVPEEHYIFNNTCIDILAIAREMLNGEIEYRRGNYDAAFTHLRNSVDLDDNLAYAEPWGWMQPTRHALGALLLEQDRLEEAEAVYRADLGLDQTLSRPTQHPENVWSLHGYVECLRKLGKEKEVMAMQPRLDLALARADVAINASCFCRLSHDCCGE